jgi:small subunit ribosomal protein S16
MLSYRGVMLKKHLQIGVLKGAISQEQADAKFNAWLSEKDSKIEGKKDQLAAAKADARKVALAAETAKNQARIDAIKAREAAAVVAAEPAAEEVEEETPAAEAPVVEEETAAAPEVEATSAEEPVVEATEEVEAPAAEETAPAVEAAAEDTTSADAADAADAGSADGGAAGE